MILDKKFIKALKKQDRKAQNTLYQKCFGILMNVALRYKNNEDDAAFLANEGFIKVLSTIEKIDTSTSIVSWLRRIMVNTAIDDFRKNKKYAGTLSMTNHDFEEVYGLSEEADLEFESTEFFQSLLNQIPRATSNVFNIYAIDGYSHKEVAEMLEISVETSKWHVKQARKKLRELYNQSENRKVG
ncbi:MAG: RNA polymerase sigma factor (sigma-70 family) [Flavobacteriales bacterium]